MQDIAGELRRWLADGESIALATVVWAEGSSPRAPGARLAVTASGRFCGSVSGGCVDGAVLAEAQEVLAGAPFKRLRYGVVDESGWDVGLACGGTIEVFVEPLVAIHRHLLDALAAETPVAFCTRLSDAAHLLAWADGRIEGELALTVTLPDFRSATSPVATLHHRPEGDLFCELFMPPPCLIVVGAVHIAVPLVSLARVLGFRTRVIDARRAFADPERFPQADEVLATWPQEVLDAEQLGPQHYIVVLTHDPKFDLPTLEIALRSRAGYIGLLGSLSTQMRRKAALAAMGFSEEELARIHGPVGLDLGGNTPEEIALAIMAEIVAARHGRRGRVVPGRDV
ncbi:MAG: XdhC/CoxI family protein [Anaerolineae bacterium]|nr:XdhC/CoxI family protein [Anaerolineae bacterium]